MAVFAERPPQVCKVVQERLGHSTIATTMDIYSHVLREMDVAAAEAFERQFHSVGAQNGAQKQDQASLAPQFNAELAIKTDRTPVAQEDRAPVS